MENACFFSPTSNSIFSSVWSFAVFFLHASLPLPPSSSYSSSSFLRGEEPPVGGEAGRQQDLLRQSCACQHCASAEGNAKSVT